MLIQGGFEITDLRTGERRKRVFAWIVLQNAFERAQAVRRLMRKGGLRASTDKPYWGVLRRCRQAMLQFLECAAVDHRPKRRVGRLGMDVNLVDRETGVIIVPGVRFATLALVLDRFAVRMGLLMS